MSNHNETVHVDCTLDCDIEVDATLDIYTAKPLVVIEMPTRNGGRFDPIKLRPIEAERLSRALARQAAAARKKDSSRRRRQAAHVDAGLAAIASIKKWQRANAKKPSASGTGTPSI